MKTVYGEPIVAGGKTIIPVATIAYGFGAGSGTATKGETEGREEGKAAGGGGGGGGVCARPLGVVEITKEETKFIPIDEKNKLLGALLLGFLIGIFLASRRSK